MVNSGLLLGNFVRVAGMEKWSELLDDAAAGRCCFRRGQTPNYFVMAGCLIAFVGMRKFKWDIIPVVLGAGALGLITKLVFKL